MKQAFVVGVRPSSRWWVQTAALVLAVALSTQAVDAQGLDELYQEPSSEKSWGGRLADAVGFDEFSRSYALVIGISSYSGGFDDLPTADGAKRMADYLFEEADFDHVRLLTEDKVTKDRVAELMSEEFPSLLDANDRFLFYWSGHGDGKAGYLPLWDTPPERWSPHDRHGGRAALESFFACAPEPVFA